MFIGAAGGPKVNVAVVVGGGGVGGGDDEGEGDVEGGWREEARVADGVGVGGREG